VRRLRSLRPPPAHARRPAPLPVSAPDPALRLPALFTAGTGFATHFAALFHPVAGEYDLARKHAECVGTIKAVDAYQAAMEELQSAVAPELDLIESRVGGPLKEFQSVLKTIRKTMTKREHKVRARACGGAGGR
jgi:hypothetical protein